jgi:hypothetical protein
MLKVLSDTIIIMNILYKIETGLMSLLIRLEDDKTPIRKDSANEKNRALYTRPFLPSFSFELFPQPTTGYHERFYRTY